MCRLTHLRKPLLWLGLVLVVFPVSALAAGPGYGQSAPTNSAAPSISGSAMLGQTLSGNAGSWSGVSLSYAYQWLRCDSAGNACAAIVGAGAASYATASADVGRTLRFAVTATNKNGALTATSNPSSVVAPPPAPPSPPQNTALPQISGTAQAGQTLSGSNGTWSGTPTSYAYQWQRCDSLGASCASIAGATSTSYGLGAADVGARLRFVVSATNQGGTTPAGSGATNAVAAAPVAPPSAPANTTLPQVTGTAQVGQTLTASNGTWSGTPTSYAYQWRRCDSAGANCTNVLGATATTYKLATGDAAATFRANVTATNAVGSATAASGQTATVAAAPAQTLNGRFGIATGGSIQNYSATDLARYLDDVKVGGAQWVRIDINWSMVQSGGATSFNWTPFDNVVNAARARGAELGPPRRHVRIDAAHELERLRDLRSSRRSALRAGRRPRIRDLERAQHLGFLGSWTGSGEVHADAEAVVCGHQAGRPVRDGHLRRTLTLRFVRQCRRAAHEPAQLPPGDVCERSRWKPRRSRVAPLQLPIRTQLLRLERLVADGRDEPERAQHHDRQRRRCQADLGDRVRLADRYLEPQRV
jgi:hypothetical protein